MSLFGTVFHSQGSFLSIFNGTNFPGLMFLALIFWIYLNFVPFNCFNRMTLRIWWCSHLFKVDLRMSLLCLPWFLFDCFLWLGSELENLVCLDSESDVLDRLSLWSVHPNSFTWWWLQKACSAWRVSITSGTAIASSALSNDSQCYNNSYQCHSTIPVYATCCIQLHID